MKKIKLLITSILILILFAFFAVIESLSTVKSMGYQLLELKTVDDWNSNRNSPVDNIVNIGPELYNKLHNHQVPQNQLTVKSMLFDCYNQSFSMRNVIITHSIVISSPNSQMCIRLSFDPLLLKYHIVGYSGTIK